MKKNNVKDNKEYLPKYWICCDCAFKKRMELPPNYVGTVTTGLCGHCKSNVPEELIPVVDFNKYYFD